MGQVPGRASLLLIGDGRLAGHLSYYFRARQLDVRQWSRRRNPPQSLPGLLAQADRVLLAIRDDALPGFLGDHRRHGGPMWVHFSGSVAVDGAWSAHPLCTFTGPPYEKAVYETIPFIVEREGPPFEELLPGLANPSASIPRAAKPLYHALCVAAGNFTQILWQELFRGFEERLGLPAELALAYLRQTCHSLERSLEDSLERSLEDNLERSLEDNLERGLEDGFEPNVLTGPIARRDRTTIRGNLQALSSAGLDGLAGVYEAFLQLADHAGPSPTLSMEVAA